MLKAEAEPGLTRTKIVYCDMTVKGFQFNDSILNALESSAR